MTDISWAVIMGQALCKANLSHALKVHSGSMRWVYEVSIAM